MKKERIARERVNWKFNVNENILLLLPLTCLQRQCRWRLRLHYMGLCLNFTPTTINKSVCKRRPDEQLQTLGNYNKSHFRDIFSLIFHYNILDVTQFFFLLTFPERSTPYLIQTNCKPYDRGIRWANYKKKNVSKPIKEWK